DPAAAAPEAAGAGLAVEEAGFPASGARLSAGAVSSASIAGFSSPVAASGSCAAPPPHATVKLATASTPIQFFTRPPLVRIRFRHETAIGRTQVTEKAQL